jgi:hypothetical protein
LKVLDGSVIERGKKNRMNIRKQVVRNPAMLNQMIRRRFLLTGGSGIDSTTTAGGFPAGLASGFDAGGAAAAGGAAMAELSFFKLLSTLENLRLADRFPG